jgi:hypothetical protein
VPRSVAFWPAWPPGEITLHDCLERVFFRCDDVEGEALASLIALQRSWTIAVERFSMINNRP